MTVTKSAIVVMISLLTFFEYGHAGEIPEFPTDISLVSKDQEIAQFLKELFSQVNIPVVISPDVEGTINSAFIGEPVNKILDKVSRTFGLIAYYDGVAVHIYEDNGIDRKVIPISKGVGQQVINNANELGLIDKKNSLKMIDSGSLIITGVNRFFEQVNELVSVAKTPKGDKKLDDSPRSNDTGFKVFFLKYAWADDVTLALGGREVVIPGVASTLRSIIGGGGVGDLHGETGSVKQLPASLPGLKGEGLAAIGKTGEDQSESSVEQQAYSPNATDGEVRIAADSRLNAVILRDTPDKIAQYEALIEALDVEPEMVEIEATIIDVNVDRLRDLGVDWVGQRTRTQSSDGTQAEAGFSPDIGGFVSYMTGDRGKFVGQINALERQGAANIISSPHILTLSNVEAIFDTSSTFYVRVAGREEVDLFNISAGTALRVTPHVFTDDNETKIKLLVTIEDGQQDDQVVDDIPTVTRSLINTQALIGPEESMLIGGLVRESNTRDQDGVPGLSRIPLLGNLFKSKVRHSERIERMFLISPKLASDNSRANNAMESQREKQLDKALTGDYEMDGESLEVLETARTKTKPSKANYVEESANGTQTNAASNNIEPLHEIVAQYPIEALLEKKQGKCSLEFTIEKNGKTKDISVISCTHPTFAETSKRAIAGFEYSPQEKNGKPIEVPTQRKTFVYETN